MIKLKSQQAKPDRWLFFLTLFLVIFGLLMVFDASFVMAVQTFSDKFHYFRLQCLWAFLGLVFLIFASLVNYHFWKKISFPLFLFSLILLILVLIPGIGLKIWGGRRWLGIGEFYFQPSELAKTTFVIYLASMFEKKRNFGQFLFLVGLVGLLVILEPDLGTSLILIFSAFVVFFVSGARLKEIFSFAFLSLIAIMIFIFTSSYRLSRFKAFLNPKNDSLNTSYHLRQVILALGSGGWLGRGIGQSRQKYLFLPDAASDSIFAVIGEEFGFLGATGLIIVFWLILARGIKISLEAEDRFGEILAAGLTSIIFIQSFLNLGSMVSLVPLTGVPLPLISYGGSSLLITLFNIGILLNISKYKTKLK